MVVTMKILVVSQYYFPESVAITPLCEGLVRLGHQVQVLTSQPQYGFGQIPKDYIKIKDEIISGVNIHRVKVSARDGKPFSILKNYWSFYQSAMRDIDTIPGTFDVVLSVSYSPIMSIAPAIQFAKKQGIPHMLYAVDMWPESLLTVNFFKNQGWMYQWLKSWSHRLYRQVDQIVVGSPSFRRHLKGIVNPNHIIKAPLYQTGLFEHLPEQVIDYGEGFHLVYAGNLGHIQGLSALVKQWQFTPQKYHLHVIGSGRFKPKLSHLIKEFKLTQRIHVYAHQTPDNLGKFLANADALYLGLTAQGIVGKTMPQKVSQYLMIGKPILANIKGDAAELLKPLKGAFFLDTQAKNLSKQLAKINGLSEKDKEHIRVESQHVYQQFLSHQATSQQLEHHLMSLVKSRKA
jgi:glycosyltransferase involved in cell wall biosynthesis